MGRVEHRVLPGQNASTGGKPECPNSFGARGNFQEHFLGHSERSSFYPVDILSGVNSQNIHIRGRLRLQKILRRGDVFRQQSFAHQPVFLGRKNV